MLVGLRASGLRGCWASCLHVGVEVASCIYSGIPGRFGRRLWQYLPSSVVNDWIYLEIYVDLLSQNKSSCKIYLEKIYFK